MNNKNQTTSVLLTVQNLFIGSTPARRYIPQTTVITVVDKFVSHIELIEPNNKNKVW